MDLEIVFIRNWVYDWFLYKVLLSLKRSKGNINVEIIKAPGEKGMAVNVD